MKPTQFYELNRIRWARKTLNFCWFTIVLHTFIHLFTWLFFSESTAYTYFTNNLLWSTLIMIGTLLITEWKFLGKDHSNVYWIVSAGMVLSIVILNNNQDTNIISAVLLLPILLSLLFFSPKALAFTFVSAVTAYAVSYMLNIEFRDKIDIYDFIGTIGILGGCTIVVFGILLRGREVLDYLNELVKINKNLKEDSNRLSKLARRDMLTGAFNHMAYHEHMDKLLPVADAGKQSVHLAVLDIDNFKAFNDSFGHCTGDLILQDVTKAMISSAEKEAFVARYGGEEFVIVWSGLTDENARQLAEKVRQEIAVISAPPPASSPVTVSIGLRRYKQSGGKEQLFTKTDKLLYQAKRSGKNKVVADFVE